MSLKAGIVGLPNVGKSTLFNAITKKNILAANYPFATIDPNVGVVVVPDKRLEVLEEMVTPENVVPTSFEFTDIAGLVKGASKGEGLGNKFLSHIREVDAICEVVRCFDDANITHVEGSTDPIRDIDIINLELIFADLEVINSRIGRIEKKAISTKDKDALFELELMKKIKDALEKDIPARRLEYTEDEEKVIKYTDITGLLMSSVKTIIDSVSYVLIAFVSISLIVSSIMIGIITYISVLERTKEIGILRAIGASKRNISSIFNAETFIVGMFSGIMGIGITILLLIPINLIIHSFNADITAVLPFTGGTILVILSVILTLIGGLIPSRKAAKQDPVTALRTE